MRTELTWHGTADNQTAVLPPAARHNRLWPYDNRRFWLCIAQASVLLATWFIFDFWNDRVQRMSSFHPNVYLVWATLCGLGLDGCCGDGVGHRNHKGRVPVERGAGRSEVHLPWVDAGQRSEEMRAANFGRGRDLAEARRRLLALLGTLVQSFPLWENAHQSCRNPFNCWGVAAYPEAKAQGLERG